MNVVIGIGIFLNDKAMDNGLTFMFFRSPLIKKITVKKNFNFMVEELLNRMTNSRLVDLTF